MSEPDEGAERRAAGQEEAEQDSEQPNKKRIDLTGPQVVAGGVATLTAATAASYLGVYGTIAGAAIMSVISTAGTAVTQRFLEDGRDKAKEKAKDLTERPSRTAARSTRADERRSGRLDATDQAPPDTSVTRSMPTIGGDEHPTANFEAGGMAGDSDTRPTEEAGDTEPGDGEDDRTWWQRYRIYVIPAVALFVAVMIVILVFELLTGRSLSDTVRGEDGASSPSILGGVTQSEDDGEGVDPGDTPGTDREQDPRDQDGQDGPGGGTERNEQPGGSDQETNQGPGGGVNPTPDGDPGNDGEQDGGEPGQDGEGDIPGDAPGGGQPEGGGTE